MAGPCRQDGDVTRLHLERTSAFTAELDFGGATRNAEHFVNAGMIMAVIVNAVSPGASPAIALEQIL